MSNNKVNNVKFFSGNSNHKLAEGIARSLNLELSHADVTHFSDGETRVEINDLVRDHKVYIVQSFCHPTNDNLMELMLMADAVRRSDSRNLTAVIPYFGYSRQDRRPGFARVPITARLVADMLQMVGFKRVVTIDIHSTQQQGFFKIPMINISATPIFVADIWRNHMHDPEHVVVVSPDVGGVKRARELAKQLDNANLAIIDKRRLEAGVSEVMNVIGDVEGRTCILVDDLIDTAGTLRNAASALKEAGAVKVIAYGTHAVLSGDAYKNIRSSKLDELVVTNTIPEHVIGPRIIRTLDIAPLIAETISRVVEKKSVSQIYM